jgi:putative hydrolase
MIRIVSDLHTHTTHSHGTGSVEDNVKAAVDQGLSAIAISDHGFSHLVYRIRDIDRYLGDINEMKAKYKGRIDVLSSVELNLIGLDGALDLPDGYAGSFDLCMFGYHKLSGYRGWRNWLYFMSPACRFAAAKNTQAYIAALQRNRVDMISHPGYGLPIDKVAVAKAAKACGAALEINAKHLDFTVEELRACAATGVNFVIGSDAHSPGRVGDFAAALERAERAGIRAAQIINAAQEGV